MKKQLVYFLFLLLLSSCQDVIEIDTPSTTPRLVVDANFNVYTNQNPSQVEGSIKLSLTTDYFDIEKKPINDAQVSITNETDGTVYPFTAIDNSGNYKSPNDSFIPEFGNLYRLNILYSNENYSAETVLIPSVPIHKVTEGSGSLFGNDDTEIIVEFTDDPSRNDFYLFDMDFNEFLTTEDEFYQGETFVFSYFYDNLSSNQEVTIKIMGLEEQFYNYMNNILEQSGEGGGSPFQPTPSTIRGNIVNTSNSANFALGYFSISETYAYTLTLN
ncbi:DUF4249 domain-containing protein [Cellulophaga sp. F20128]|uniref:DUF4249 domain-containing protein n=1 Tax=Cellulophaga sp. F20128 TaxID=2926413 RepID=UPI001FF51C6F|nr:DUF4249 domain-containing protein [Cellulophaga sp. F20128]MCK0157215.1 DUF4249 domain-containing protein [Cellulophaga sp. F20128]